MKFKLGDYVRIKTIKKEDMRNYGRYIGVVGKINEIKSDNILGMYYYIKFPYQFGGKHFLGVYEEEIEILTEEQYFLEVL